MVKGLEEVKSSRKRGRFVSCAVMETTDERTGFLSTAYNRCRFTFFSGEKQEMKNIVTKVMTHFMEDQTQEDIPFRFLVLRAN